MTNAHDPTHDQSLTNPMTPPTTNHWAINDQPMFINAGEASRFRLHQVGNCNNMLIIDLSSPASPLQNIDNPLTTH